MRVSCYLFVLLFFCGVAGAEMTLFVSPTGNDKNKGTKKFPLKTIPKALEKGAASSEENIIVLLRGGVYRIKESIVLDREKLKSKKWTLSAYEKEIPRINGGKKIPVSALKKSDEERIRTEVKDKVRVIDLKKAGIKAQGIHAVGFGRESRPSWTEIFIDGKPCHLSRWPNEGSELIGAVVVAGNEKDKKEGKVPVFGFKSDRPLKWKPSSQIWLSGYFAYGYADDMLPLKKIDGEKKEITLGMCSHYPLLTGASFRKWNALNVLEELDLPGEYVLDQEKKKLYVYPFQDKPELVEISVMGDPLMRVENVNDVTIRGLVFECSRGVGLYMEGTENVVAENCVFQNLGNVAVCMGHGVEIYKSLLDSSNAVPSEDTLTDAAKKVRPCKGVGDTLWMIYDNTVFYRNGGTRSGLRHCLIQDVGAGGVNMSGGDRKSLRKGENFVENCEITRFNRIEKSYRPGVWMDGVGNRISQCDIHMAPSMAVLFHGNEHLIELCKIYDVCREVDDQGAIYYGRDPSERGNIVRYNYFNELSPRHRVTSVYADDGACDERIYGNIFRHAGSLPILLGGGQDHLVKHNIFLECSFAIHMDNRLQNWAANMVKRGELFEKRLEAVDYKNPPYSKAYPSLVSYFEQNPALPQRNKAEENVFYKVPRLKNGKPEWLEWGDNWQTEENPGFVDVNDPLKGWSTDAPVFKKYPDFPRIPLEKIGAKLPMEK